MKSIAYCNPFVPPEWIAAHRLRPQWLRPRAARGESATTHRGVCPAAAAIVESLTVDCSEPPTGVVLTTTCDQMRYAASLLSGDIKAPVFLFNVPRTWLTDAAQALYIDELRRLGRFLESLGGRAPSDDMLRETMFRYDLARCELLRRREEMSAREFSTAVADVRGELPQNIASSFCSHTDRAGEKILLALVGGPLLKNDDALLDAIEHCGGRIVLDATESGERTLPAPLDESRRQADPLAELARMYFQSIPDIFRRPNDELFVWLASETTRRGARGIVVRRHLWCDLWHAELPRLSEECGLPLLEWEHGGDGSAAGFATRIEAFLEMLAAADNHNA